MNNYTAIEHNKDYNMKELSAKVSCNNMSVLSSKYTLSQNRIFTDKINMEICEFHNNYGDNIDDIKNNESELLKGFSIHKKSCIYKRPLYDKGEWESQYGISDIYKDQMNSYRLFDYQSKSKTIRNTSDITTNCDNSDFSNFKSLGECEKVPKYTFVRTFTNNYDSCV
jgi:hypothetical protein